MWKLISLVVFQPEIYSFLAILFQYLGLVETKKLKSQGQLDQLKTLEDSRALRSVLRNNMHFLSSILHLPPISDTRKP